MPAVVGLVLDRNRKLQLAGVLALIVSRIAAAPDLFSDEHVFRNVRAERVVVRKHMYDWLKRSKLVVGDPEGYRVLDRPGISALSLLLRKNPLHAVNSFLNSRDEKKGETGETEEQEVFEPEEEQTGETVQDAPDEEESPAASEDIPEPIPEDDKNYPPEESDGRDLDVPAVKETLLELEKMINGAGTKNRARYVLSINALTLMMASVPDGTFLTRKDVFMLSKWQNHEKCVTNELAAKSWQKVFLDRTEECGLTEKTMVGRDSGYRVADGKTNEAILMISDAVHKDGLSLRKILWPSQYGEEEQSQEEPEETEHPAQDGAIEVLSELVGQLRAVAESMSTVNDSMKAVLSGLSELGEQGRERDKMIQKSLEPVLSGLSAIVAKLNLEERDAVLSLKDRLVEIQTRRRSLSNQLESEISREEKLLEEIGAVLGKKP